MIVNNPRPLQFGEQWFEPAGSGDPVPAVEIAG